MTLHAVETNWASNWSNCPANELELSSLSRDSGNLAQHFSDFSKRTDLSEIIVQHGLWALHSFLWIIAVWCYWASAVWLCQVRICMCVCLSYVCICICIWWNSFVFPPQRQKNWFCYKRKATASERASGLLNSLTQHHCLRKLCIAWLPRTDWLSSGSSKWRLPSVCNSGHPFMRGFLRSIGYPTPLLDFIHSLPTM